MIFSKTARWQLLIPFYIRKSLIMEIKPSDVQQSMGNSNSEKQQHWRGLSNMDLIDIYQFTLQYQIFERLKRALDLPFLRYHYVVPKSLDLGKVSVNRIMCRNPPLCLRWIRFSTSQNSPTENLFYSICSLDIPVYLCAIFDRSQSMESTAAPEVSYLAQSRVPPLLFDRLRDGFTGMVHIYTSSNAVLP